MMRRSYVILIVSFYFCASLSAFAQSRGKDVLDTKDSVSVEASLLADMIIKEAYKYQGVPYRYGANGPNAFDCTGFTRWVFKKFGITLSRSAKTQAKDGRAVSGSLSELQKGDILIFGGRSKLSIPGHAGIFIELDESGEDFSFIHAAVKGGVQVSHLKETYYRTRFLGARRILPDFVKDSVKIDPIKLDSLISADVVVTPDTLSLGDEDRRILVMENGEWSYLSSDGHLEKPSQDYYLVLQGDGRWKKVMVSRNKIPQINEDAVTETQPSTKVVPAKSETGALYHTVRQGDTLSGIAARYHTKVSTICRINGISATTVLRVGRKLRVK